MNRVNKKANDLEAAARECRREMVKRSDASKAIRALIDTLENEKEPEVNITKRLLDALSIAVKDLKESRRGYAYLADVYSNNAKLAEKENK